MPEKDDLEAVRSVVSALEGFPAEEQERVIRWAREKLNLPATGAGVPTTGGPSGAQNLTPSVAATAVQQGVPRNLRTFVAEKQPKSDVQFAATVAFYHRFEAPEGQRKTEINADDLRDACRLVNRERLHDPLQTLQNARNLGLLDRPSRGVFSINSVGENLVAMTLPGDGKNAQLKGKTKRVKSTRGKKSAK